MKLKNQVAIVTGATSGMGRAIAKILHREGAKIILGGRKEEQGKRLSGELNDKRENTAFFVSGDIGLPETNSQLVECALSRFGQLHIVIANAGTLGLGKVTELSTDLWNQTMDTNLGSLFHLSKYSLPYLQESQGTLIANASIAAFKSFPNHPAYCASKAAVVSLIRQMALDYGPQVRINAICPGPVDTPLIWDSAKAFDNPDRIVEQVGEGTPLKRLGTPEDVAELVLFLASEDASWITGSAINIDGGVMVSS